MLVRLLRYLQVPAVVALFAFLLWKTDLADVRDALGAIDPLRIAAVVAINLAIVVLFAVRSHFVLLRLGHRLRPELLLAVAILGNVAGSHTPASSGEVLRAAALRSHARVSTRDGAALVLFERALSLYVLVLGTAVAAAWLLLPQVVAAAATACGAVLFWLPAAAGRPLRWAARAAGRSPRRGPGDLLRRFEDVAARLQLLVDDRPLLACWTAITVGIYALVTLQFWLVALGLANTIRIDEAWTALGGSLLAGYASLLPFGLGAADGSLAALLRRFGMTLEQGTAVALLVRATSTLPMLLLALASYLYLARRAPADAQPEIAAAID